jgi:hypothetical protein
MASRVHTHGNAPPHEHADAVPGHGHDAQGNVTGVTGAAATTVAEPGEERIIEERRAGGGLAGRLIFGVVGALGMIVGPFLPWISGQRGTEVEFRALFSSEGGADAGFVASAGFGLLVLGVLALIGLVFRSGWLTSLASAVGLAAMILVAFGRFRGEGGGLGDLGIGWWIGAVGSLLALIASMFATRTKVVEVRERTV